MRDYYVLQLLFQQPLYKVLWPTHCPSLGSNVAAWFILLNHKNVNFLDSFAQKTKLNVVNYGLWQVNIKRRRRRWCGGAGRNSADLEQADSRLNQRLAYYGSAEQRLRLRHSSNIQYIHIYSIYIDLLHCLLAAGKTVSGCAWAPTEWVREWEGFTAASTYLYLY